MLQLLALASGTTSQEIDPRLAASLKAAQAAREAVWSECGTLERSYSMASLAGQPDTPFRIARTRWTGGCVEGKLDGQGTLEITTTPGPGAPPAFKVMVNRAIGLMVRGKPVGPWLVEEAPAPGFAGTYFWLDAPVSGQYIKQPDGSFRLAQMDFPTKTFKPVETSVPISDADVKRHMARALAGGTGVSVKTPYRSALLEDLLGRAVYAAPSRSLQGSERAHVALVMTTNALAAMSEMDRFAVVVRQWAAAQSDPALRASAEQLAATANKENFLKGLTELLREKFAAVVPVQDVAEVDRSRTDYIVIFDFAFRHGGQAMLDEIAINARKRVKLEQLSDYFQKTPPSSLDIQVGASHFILNKDLEVVRAQEASAKPMGMTLPTPLTDGSGNVDEGVAQSVSANLQLRATLLKNALGSEKYTFIGTQRFENMAAVTRPLRWEWFKP